MTQLRSSRYGGNLPVHAPAPPLPCVSLLLFPFTSHYSPTTTLSQAFHLQSSTQQVNRPASPPPTPSTSKPRHHGCHRFLRKNPIPTLRSLRYRFKTDPRGSQFESLVNAITACFMAIVNGIIAIVKAIINVSFLS